jgi:hypothetical protein
VTRNLILSGGIYHPFAETSAAIAAHLAPLGITSDICSVAEGLERLLHQDFDLVTVNALAFSMTQAEKYAPLRAEHGFEISASAQAALGAHVAAGRGLLGLHTAPICFDTWPGWADLLGVEWVWGQSGHPMPDYLLVTQNGTTRRIWDELYGGLRLHPEAPVLATARLASGGAEQPVLTVRGPAVYLALGHDMTAVGTDEYAELLKLAVGKALAPGRKGV